MSSQRKLINKKPKVAVHDGSFHADEIFAVAILSMYLKKPLSIFRTRDDKVISKMDYVLDVGTIYDPSKNRFDHHQENWNKKRDNGIIYAACGLVWKEFGEKITGSKEIAGIVDRKIIQTIDAEDNGMNLWNLKIERVIPFCFADFLYSMNSTYKEKKANTDSIFKKAVDITVEMLGREIKRAGDYTSSLEEMREIYNDAVDKRIIVLEEDYLWKDFFSSYPEPLFIIKPSSDKREGWYAYTVEEKGEKFKLRIEFPQTWAGKRNEELVKISGIKGAIFCHNKRFMAAASTKEEAIALSKKALSIYESKI